MSVLFKPFFSILICISKYKLGISFQKIRLLIHFDSIRLIIRNCLLHLVHFDIFVVYFIFVVSISRWCSILSCLIFDYFSHVYMSPFAWAFSLFAVFCKQTYINYVYMFNVGFAKIMQTNQKLRFIYKLTHLWGF